MNTYNNRGGHKGGFAKKSYGGNDRNGRDRDTGRTQTLHDATCADCGNKTQVPFRPTGDKPVFCRDCFGAKRDGGHNRSERGGSLDTKRSDRGGDRREFNTRTLTNPGTESSPFADMSKLKTQMEMLHQKMDTLLGLLSGQDVSPMQTATVTETPIKPQVEKRTKKVQTADLKKTLAAIQKTTSPVKKSEKKSSPKKTSVQKAAPKKVAIKKSTPKKVTAKK